MRDFIFLHTKACLMLLVCLLTEEGTRSTAREKKKR